MLFSFFLISSRRQWGKPKNIQPKKKIDRNTTHQIKLKKQMTIGNIAIKSMDFQKCQVEFFITLYDLWIFIFLFYFFIFISTTLTGFFGLSKVHVRRRVCFLSYTFRTQKISRYKEHMFLSMGSINLLWIFNIQSIKSMMLLILCIVYILEYYNAYEILWILPFGVFFPQTTL